MELGIEVAKVNPQVTIGDQAGLEEWLEIFWEGNGNKQLATGGFAKFLDRPGDSQDQLSQLDYSIQLVKTVNLINDPEVKLVAHSAEHLSYVLNLGSSYAALAPDINSVSPGDSSFLGLVAQGDKQGAANELTKLIRDALGGLKYEKERSITKQDNSIYIEGGGGRPLENGDRFDLAFNRDDLDPSNDRYLVAYKVRRADGTVEAPVPGDTIFRAYLNRGDTSGLQPGEVPLYPGDTLLEPLPKDDPLGEEGILSLKNKNYSELQKVFDALKLTPYTAGPTVEGQIKAFVKLITENPLVAGVAGVAVGGIAIAQVIQPIGVILDVGLILLGGVQFGLSLASFFSMAANAKSQADLLAASQEAVHAFENLISAVPFGGLLKLDPSQGLLNTTRLLDAGKRILRVADDIKNGRALTFADAISIPLSLFKGEETAIGKLLQYGTNGVSEFLKGGFSKFTNGLPTIEGLKDFADRFERVSEIAAKLNENADIAAALANNTRALGAILEFGPEAVEILLRRASFGEDSSLWIKRLAEISLSEGVQFFDSFSKTVWNSIKATQPLYEGTSIPRSFEIAVSNGEKFWIHGNASEHLPEKILGYIRSRGSSQGAELYTQLLLEDLRGAISQAADQGIQYGQLVRTGKWELIFNPPLEPGQLPTVFHARPIGDI